MSQFNYRVLVHNRGHHRWPIVSSVSRDESNLETIVERQTSKHGLEKFKLVGTAGNIAIYEIVE